MQSIDNVLKLRKGLKPDDPNPDIFDVLWAKKLSGAARDYTITGNPLSFLAKKAQTAVSTKVTLKPVQDLHGYDNPWPAGGGKNKFDGVVYQADSNYDASGNITSSENYDIYKCDLLSEGRNTISFYDSSTEQTGMTVRMIPYDSSDNPLSGFLITDKYSSTTDQIVRSFTIPEGTAYILFGLRKTTNTVQLESGSSATSYTPYSNICPISGRSSVEINGCEKNIIETVADNVIYSSANKNVIEFNNDIISFTPSYGTSTAFFLLKIFKVTSGMVGKTFTYSYQSSPGLSTYNSTFVFCDEDGGNRTSVRNNHQIIESEVGKIFTMRFYSSDNTKIYTISQIQVEEGESATTYEPYAESNDVTITFGETVYGGTLDVENGVLTVDKTIVTIKNYNWLYDDSSGGFFKYAFSSKKRNDDYMISTVLRYSNNTASNMPPYSMKQGASSYPTRIMIKMPSDVTTQNQLFELIGNEKIVFNLNTPTTIQLTPEQIQILKGQNTIWIEDEGVTIALTYKN